MNNDEIYMMLKVIYRQISHDNDAPRYIDILNEVEKIYQYLTDVLSVGEHREQYEKFMKNRKDEAEKAWEAQLPFYF